MNEKFAEREPECFISGFPLETDLSGSDAMPLEGLPVQVAALSQCAMYKDEVLTLFCPLYDLFRSIKIPNS